MHDGHGRMMRTRFLSTELDMKEKLFIGILTGQQTIETLGAAVNKTLSHRVEKMKMFVNAPRDVTPPPGLPIVSFSDEKVGGVRLQVCGTRCEMILI